ncbi:MAG: diguanylate cyclase [Deltaproteobacteria bacterium]|nr:diguanylate cyclase [Deltaproteobacteria bacterium]
MNPVLIAHENRELSDRIYADLTGRGYFILRTYNYEDTMDAVEAGVFEGAVIPVAMSQKAGINIARRIKKIYSGSKIVVLFSKDSKKSIYNKYKDRGVVDALLDEKVDVVSISDTLCELIGLAPSMTLIPDLPFSSSSIPPAGFSLPPRMSVFPKRAVPSLMPPFEDEETQNQLISLAREYQKKLPSEFERLKEELATAKDDPEDEDVLIELRRHTHTLTGTSGTLGFMEISRIVKEINLIINKIEREGASVTDWEKLDYLINRAISTPERTTLVPTGITGGVTVASILLISEDEDIRSDIKNSAANCMVTVICAETSDEARDIVEKYDIDGILIDFEISNINPVELAHLLKGIDPSKLVPIAFISEHDTMENRISAASAGANHFIKKPVSDDDIQVIARDFSSISQAESATILLVDDDDFFRKHIRSILEGEKAIVRELDEPSRILETLDEVAPDILLLDVQMPKITGWEVCRMVRAVPAWKNLPVLFLTGESDANARIECFKSGGDDYIQKPVVKEELIARINVRLERIRLFKERGDKDPLTGLLNRRAFLEQLQLLFKKSRQFERPVSISILDLDKFKSVNDTYGHLAGDNVLAAMGKLLLTRFRNVDIRGRWGGEEFSVIFANEDEQTAKRLLEEVKKDLKKIVFKSDNNREFNISFSSGIATFPKDGENFDALFKIADDNLYRAKEAGRDRVFTNQD